MSSLCSCTMEDSSSVDWCYDYFSRSVESTMRELPELKPENRSDSNDSFFCRSYRCCGCRRTTASRVDSPISSSCWTSDVPCLCFCLVFSYKIVDRTIHVRAMTERCFRIDCPIVSVESSKNYDDLETVFENSFFPYF